VLWSIFSSLPQPLMAVAGFLHRSTLEPLLRSDWDWAGAMIWMIGAEVLPDVGAKPAKSIGVALLQGSSDVSYEFLI